MNRFRNVFILFFLVVGLAGHLDAQRGGARPRPYRPPSRPYETYRPNEAYRPNEEYRPFESVRPGEPFRGGELGRINPETFGDLIKTKDEATQERALKRLASDPTYRDLLEGLKKAHPDLFPDKVREAAEKQRIAQEQAQRTAILTNAQRTLRDLKLYRGQLGGERTAEFSAALLAFQEEYGLTVDGKFGPETGAALGRVRRAALLNAANDTSALILETTTNEELYSLFDVRGRPLYRGNRIEELVRKFPTDSAFHLSLVGFSTARSAALTLRLQALANEYATQPSLERRGGIRSNGITLTRSNSSQTRVTVERETASSSKDDTFKITKTEATRETVIDSVNRDPNRTLQQRIIALDTSGDFSILRTPQGTLVLIDAGLRTWSSEQMGREIPPGSHVKIILSHLDSDHIGNAAGLLQRADITVEEVVISSQTTGTNRVGELMRVLAEKNYRRQLLADSGILVYSKPDVPRATYIERPAGNGLASYRMNIEPEVDIDLFQLRNARTANESSIVTMVTHQKTRTLYTGDVTPNVLQALSAGISSSAGEPVAVSFFKWPHHAWIPKTAEAREILLSTLGRFKTSRILFSVRPNVDLPGQGVEAVQQFLREYLPSQTFEFFVTREDGTIMLLTLELQMHCDASAAECPSNGEAQSALAEANRGAPYSFLYAGEAPVEVHSRKTSYGLFWRL